MTREEKNQYILENTIVDTTYPSAKQFHDISGTTINHLTAIRYVGRSRTNQKYYEWRCECGNTIIAQQGNVMSENTISCGCVGRKKIIENNTRHGLSRHPLYKKYYRMRGRCYIEHDEHYPNYGGRGIYVCDEWMDPENGYEKDLSIDRIDVNGPYAPWNCRWVDNKVQANNKRTNHLLTYKTYTYSIADWADICDLTVDAIHGRIKNGWDIERILFTPLNNMKGIHLFVIPPEYLKLNKYRETP